MKKYLIFMLCCLLGFGGNAMAFTLQSTAFQEGNRIPSQYTCDAENISPPLSWNGFPKETKSFALIMDDPDAPRGTWTHWVLFNIPANINAFPENMLSYPAGILGGLNSWNKTTYGGPCPPSGTHRYYFKLYALDAVLDLPSGADLSSLNAAIQSHLLDKAQLMGTYQKIKYTHHI